MTPPISVSPLPVIVRTRFEIVATLPKMFIGIDELLVQVWNRLAVLRS